MNTDPRNPLRPSRVLWTTFFVIAIADIFIPGPSFSVFCIPVFFAFLVVVRPRSPWPLASAAACFLVGAWLLEQGLSHEGTGDELAAYRLADRVLISVAILVLTAIHSRLQLLHDEVVPLYADRSAGRLAAADADTFRSHRATVITLSLLTLAVISGLDVVTPRNWNFGPLYLLPVLWASALERPLHLAWLTPLAAALSIAGYYLGTASSLLPEPSTVFTERVITIVTLVLSGAVLVGYALWKGQKTGSERNVRA